MEKVYCKNCKLEWHWEDTWVCKRKVKFKNQAAGVEGTTKLGGVYCKEVNANNDCPYYKRKWYLFWIK